MKDTKFRAQKSNAPSESLIWLSANTNPISFIHSFIICLHLFYAGFQGLESIPADFGCFYLSAISPIFVAACFVLLSTRESEHQPRLSQGHCKLVLYCVLGQEV